MEAIMWNCNMRKLLMPARCRLVHSPSAFRLLIQQQSSAAKWHNITPTLHDILHWLPISQRITFKIALMVFDCSRGRCPKYFSDVYIPVHTVTARSRLRSAVHGDLVDTRVRSRFGCHSFRVSGPTIWNDLPVDIRSTDIIREQFKRSLKIWLFECAYGRRRVWETVQSEGKPKKWTYLLTYNKADDYKDNDQNTNDADDSVNYYRQQ